MTRHGNVVYHHDGTATHAETGAPVKLDTWIITGTHATEPYPCRCDRGRPCRPDRCPCSGRTDDLSHLPPSCCAVRHLRLVADS